LNPFRQHRTFWYVLIAVLPLVLGICSIFMGRYPVSIRDISALAAAVLTGQEAHPTHFSVIVHVRMPRVILGALVGGSLAVSGAAFQGLFRNPLVSSGMLGVSSGAGFGAALALVLFDRYGYVYPLSFCFGLLAVLLCFFIGRITASTQAITLVLGGVIVGSIFSALISLLKYLADPYDELPAIVFWLMGSLSRAEYDHILTAGVPMAPERAGHGRPGSPFSGPQRQHQPDIHYCVRHPGDRRRRVCERCHRMGGPGGPAHGPDDHRQRQQGPDTGGVLHGGRVPDPGG
jgi:iron complex transport system permease protein